jgi:hypothetical protein
MRCSRCQSKGGGDATLHALYQDALYQGHNHRIRRLRHPRLPSSRDLRQLTRLAFIAVFKCLDYDVGILSCTEGSDAVRATRERCLEPLLQPSGPRGLTDEISLPV